MKFQALYVAGWFENKKWTKRNLLFILYVMYDLLANIVKLESKGFN